MQRSITLLLAVAACTGRSSDADTSNPARSTPEVPRAAVSWTVKPDSFGRVPLGVPLADVMAVLGDSIPVDLSRFDACDQVKLPSLPPGTSLMLIRDSAGAPIRVDRVDVDTAGIRTSEGAGVGDSEDSVRTLYAGRIQVEPHKYTAGGHYLIVPGARDTMFQIIFETDGHSIVRLRSGRRPAVQFVEGCA